MNDIVQERFILSKDGSLHRKSCDSLKKKKTFFLMRKAVKMHWWLFGKCRLPVALPLTSTFIYCATDAHANSSLPVNGA